MKKHIVTLVVALSALSGAVFGQQSISVTVRSSAKGGVVHAALCNNPDTFLDQKLKDAFAPINADGTVTLTFSRIPKGDYAVRVYQDTNNDGLLNVGLFGMPKEPFGFSNNPPTTFGPPSFNEAKFSVANQPVALMVDMKNTK